MTAEVIPPDEAVRPGPPSPPAIRGMTRRAARWRRHGTSLLMMAPFAALFVVFVIYPLGRSLYLSFTNYRGIKPPVWIGLENYTSLLEDERFRKAVVNTFLYVAGTVTLTTALALCVALAFRGQSWRHRTVRVLFFLPSVTSAIALNLIWKWIFSPEDYGFANQVVGVFGVERVEWLSTPPLAVPVLIFMGVWGGIGYGMVIFVAGLNAIPEEYYESARMDGATSWQQFRKITLPLLRPVTAYVVITGLIGAFQIFEAVFIIFFRSAGVIGGLHDSALMIVPYLYDQGFGHFYLGRASAIAWVLLIIIFVISMIHLRITKANRDLT
ncbi:sugar ABC transporter permease [Luedemannella helvata]|uniref:Sugar ABC transporter permease n=1 Tax=Luedemannella helvata TaxID=349315 RepID=A0ABN2JXU7_9ACTN